MIITKERITQFFEDRCSAADADIIYRYLQENPDWVHHWFDEEEWANFQHTEDLPESWSQHLLATINAEKDPAAASRRKNKVRWIWGVRAAAAVVIVILSGLLFYRQLHEKKQGPLTPAIAYAADAGTGRDTALINRTNRSMKLRLEDGSVVELSPLSRLDYHRGFQKDERTILLSGEAVFRIASEKSRPFTVFTKGFSTTALGTEFKVTAFAGSRTNYIQLLSGKVLVRNLQHPDQTQYLIAGQQCVFNTIKNSLARTANRSTAVLDPSVSSGLEENDSEIQFKNESLTRVFSKLSELYHTPIHYDRTEMNKRKFTGNVQKGQPLAEALKIITLLNDLRVDRTDDSVYRVMPGR